MKLNNLLAFLSLLVAFAADGQSHLANGISQYQSGNYANAAKSFESVSEKSREYAEARYYLGRIAYDEKEYDDATDFFIDATEVNPQSGDYFAWLGDTYAAIGTNGNLFTKMSVGPKALKSWEQAAALDPKNIKVRVSLVDSYMMAPAMMGGGEDKAKATATEAIALLGESLKKSPDNYLHHYWYGKMAAITGLRLEEGEVSLRKYLTHTPAKDEPSLAGANMRLGQIKEKQGNLPEAKKYYQAALKLDSNLGGAQKGLERVSK
jgi:tetratricopeptide (TPR) repeat protein